MKIKTFIGWSDKGLDKKVNNFLRINPVEVIDIKFANPLFYYSVIVFYRESSVLENE